MSHFETQGPLDVLFEGTADRKFIRPDLAVAFWESTEHAPFADRKGVYVFAVKTGKTKFIPIYVGKATKNFRQEAFAVGKREHYNHALRSWRKSRPVLFLLMHPTQRGSPNVKAIGEIEKFLIKLGKDVNPDLKNTHHAGEAPWELDCLGKKGPGKPRESVSLFRRMMKIG